MSTFDVRLEIGNPQGEQWEPVQALVDTGSTFTSIPADVLGRLGVQRTRRAELETATDRIIVRDLGQTWLRYDGQAEITWVVFADEDSEPLLGALTLESLLLAVDPIHQRLVPIPGLG